MSPVKAERAAVIGGSGFLGRYIVEELLAEYDETVTILDLRETWTHPRVKFIQVDIRDKDAVSAALTGIDVVYHTASPVHGKSSQVYFDVSVLGTESIIKACHVARVSKLVFTSSASVVFNGNDIKGGDESLPYCEKHIDAYNETKALAEQLVIEAHNPKKLKTCAIRPSGIFGPRDMQGWPAFIEAGKAGKTKYIVGDGKNVMDWSYVENVAMSHVLAAKKLDDEERVGGQAFFITNDEPIRFWDMPTYICKNMGYPEPRIHIPYTLMLYLAMLMDLIAAIVSPFIAFHPTFTKFRIVNVGVNRYFNIQKAKDLLGYKPRYTLKAALALTLEYFKEEEAKKAHRKAA